MPTCSLSPIFRGCVGWCDRNGDRTLRYERAVGAAKGAGIGAGIYASAEEAFASLKKINVIEPDGLKADKYCGAFEVWKERLEKALA